MHGFLTRDGIPPGEFRRAARADLGRYDTVELRDGEIESASIVDGGFEVCPRDAEPEMGRTLLLCTGVVDDVPAIDGLEPMYGTSVHHCPFCDGWEHRDEPIAIYGCGESAGKYALGMRQWSRDLALCTNGPEGLAPELREQLDANGIRVRAERIVRLEGEAGKLRRIHFESGPPLERSAMFFCTGQRQRSDLAARIGAQYNEKGTVDTHGAERTTVPGLWVAGDASKDAQLVIVAAAEGAAAAVAINTELTRHDLAASAHAP